MPSIRPSLSAALLLAIATMPSAGHTLAAEPTLRVAGEPSATPKSQAAPAWRATAFPAQSLTRLSYGEMSAERILKLREDNASRSDKIQIIGIGRSASEESVKRQLPALRWISQKDGSSVARLEFISPLAYGLRVGLKIESLDPRAEFRFSGSALPGVVVSKLDGQQILHVLDGSKMFWTPGTDGEKQYIEVWIPADVPRQRIRLQAPHLSHLMTNPVDDFKILDDIGLAGSCNINTICRAGSLGQRYVDAKASVVKLTFMVGNDTGRCTGTLLNDTDPSSQIPYIHTAHHCISTQERAATLNTYWMFEASTCPGNNVNSFEIMGGGSDFLYSNAATDGALLRLNQPAPGYAVFSGWDATALATGNTVTAIHHPRGDLKKVSFGQRTLTYNDQQRVGWLEGTTEPGSSGSGIFTFDDYSYYLRGGLHYGDASCANTGNLSTAGNFDVYSRLDVDFPGIQQWLAPVPATPKRRNGSQPLAPPR